MKDSKLFILILCLVGFFIISLLLSFNSGFSQGVEKVRECFGMGGLVSFDDNNFECVNLSVYEGDNFYGINLSNGGVLV